MMCLEEGKDYMSEEIQNPEPCEPYEPVQNFEKPETPQDPEPFIIHTNPGKENLILLLILCILYLYIPEGSS